MGDSNSITRDLVFVGFNSRVAALNVRNGNLVWEWKAPAGYGYVTIPPIQDNRVIVSVMGYTYCLNAQNGRQIWNNNLAGFGTGVASLASRGDHNGHHTAMAAAASQTQNTAATT